MTRPLLVVLALAACQDPELQSQIDALEAELAATQARVETLEQASLPGSIAAVEARVKALEDAGYLDQAAIDELGFTDAIAGLEQTVTELEGDLAALDTRLTATEVTVGAQATDLAAQQATLTAQASTLGTHGSAISDHTTRITSVESTVSLQGVSISTHTSQISTLGKDLDAAEVEIVGLKTRATNAETDISGLKTRATNAETDISGLKTRATNAETDISGLKTRATNAETDIGGLKTRATNAETDITSLTGRVKTTEDDLVDLDARFGTSEAGFDARLDLAESDLTSLKSRTTTAEADLLDLETRLEDEEALSTELLAYSDWHFFQGSGRSDADSGLLSTHTLTFTKALKDSQILVTWYDNFRVYNSGSGRTCQWEVLIDGNSCKTPGKILADEHVGYDNNNTHHPATVTSVCSETTAGAIGAGSHTLTVRINGAVSGHLAGDCWTGWYDQHIMLAAREIPK